MSLFSLKQFSWVLGIILVAEIVLAVLAFVFSDILEDKVTDILEEEGIQRYRDDPDFQNLVDWFQEEVSFFYNHLVLVVVLIISRVFKEASGMD